MKQATKLKAESGERIPERREVTLATLEAMPAAPITPRALVDCNLAQLEILHQNFADLAKLHERGSGVAATLRGLVLTEIKLKVGRGEFMPWVKAHYGKSHRTATDYMRIAGKFVKDSKLAEPCQFDFLTQSAGEILAGVEELRLDLNNPTIAAVVNWSKNQSAHQLLLDLGPAKKGGKTYDRDGDKGKHAKPTAQELVALGHSFCTDLAERTAEFCKRDWYVYLKVRAERAGMIDHLRESLERMIAFDKLTDEQREDILATHLKKQLGATGKTGARKAESGKGKK